MNMSWIKSERTKEVLIIAAMSIGLLLLIDGFLGYSILKHVPIDSRNSAERGIRIKHPVYHHTLAASYDGYARGQSEYRFCTNPDGLKSKCGDSGDNKTYDIGFLGDSFTEGLGLPYEQTFVGLIAEQMPEKKIANLGVMSYSPTIYYLRLIDFLDKGYTFKELVVYIDISDIQDEANYTIVDGRVVDTIKNIQKQQMFPLLNFGLKGLRDRLRTIFFPDFRPEVEEPVYSRNFRRGAWTFDPGDEGYGKVGVKGAIDKSLVMMERLYELCQKRGIKVSVAVYPWPGQILYDVEESRQVKIWREFCAGKCANFYNSFPTFFGLAKSSSKEAVISNYYFKDDMHFNEIGNKLIASDFIKGYKSR